MKSILAIFIAFGTTICSAQSNLDFEKWNINYKGVDEAKYWVNTSDASEHNAPKTIFKEVDNPVSGLANIKLTTAYWATGASFGLDTLVGALMQQSIYNERPESFEFSYKAIPQLGDEILVGVQLTVTINGSMIVIGEGFFTSNQVEKNWIKKTVNIEYYSDYTPDNISIIALSSANAVITNGENGYAKVGSTLFLDNLKLNAEAKVSEDNYYIHVFPNPAKEFVNIKTNSSEKQQIEIYDLSGKVLLKTTFNQQSRIDISALPSGTYIYKVFSALTGKIKASNKFNVIR